MADKSLYTLTFGKHKGKDIEDVETDYLVWLCEQGWFEKDHPIGLKSIETELNFRKKWGK